jgi:serine/threonine protein phosphatase PrpC
VVAVEDGAVQPYHVGDSPIVVAGGRGRVKHQSLSHGPVGYAVEAGLLSEAEAMGHEERHLVSNLLGTPEMRVELGPRLPLAIRDTVLLASDGVSDNLYLDEIVETIRKGPLDRAGAALARRCRARMLEPAPGDPSKEDDYTFILFRRRRDAPPGPGK